MDPAIGMPSSNRTTIFFFNQHLSDPAGELRIDIDLVHFDAPLPTEMPANSSG